MVLSPTFNRFIWVQFPVDPPFYTLLPLTLTFYLELEIIYDRRTVSGLLNRSP